MGSADDFRRCYDPSWGRHRGRTRPSPGNHEYSSGGGGPYFDYFGANAGPAGAGYYGYTVGPWRVISLNSEIPAGSGSAQMDWLRQELSRNPSDCMAVYWHRPRFSSGFAPQDADGRFEPARGIREFVVGTGAVPLYGFPGAHANSEIRAAVWGVAVFTLFDGGYRWEFVPVEGQTFQDRGTGSCH